ncbi:MAG: spiro-SPASM protein [Treponema sp.]|nr:spiro-SPASM protein [Treponema sp.]
MKNIIVLYAGNVSSHAFEPHFDGKNALQMCLERAKQFPGAEKIVLLAKETFDLPGLTGIEIEKRENWTKKSLLVKISELQTGFDLIYFVFADCPFLDPSLAGKIAERHIKYACEYSYADGWPFGLAPEILTPGTPGILANITGSEDGPVEKDMLFSVIQKDINAFDIEAEISSIDHRCHRLDFCADSKRNLLILKNFYKEAGKIPSCDDVTRIIEEKPQILRSLPAFFPIQVYGGCPQKCSICPYPAHTDATGRKDFMESEKFESLLEKIIDFSGDAVIDLSLWGELSLHPEKLKLIENVLKHPELSLIVETSGLGWKNEELEKCLDIAKKTDTGKKANKLSRLSWIVSLDTTEASRYANLRGAGFAEAENCAKKLFSLFPNDSYVQAVRVKGEENDTEKFYRYWKENAPSGDKNVIIQKYDDFCGSMEKKQASDISPVIRKPCWHIMRDFPILIDGTVPVCREDLSVIKGEKNNVLGNVFADSPEIIWEKGDKFYTEHCNKKYSGLCAECDEYYTYNF